MNEFSQTVDLKEQMEQKKKAQKKPAKKAAVSAGAEKKVRAGRDALDEMYEEDKQNIKNIDRPAVKERKERGSRAVYNIIIVILLLALGYFAFFDQAGSAPEVNYEPKWYKVTLTSGESYYGLITDISADPVLIENVYYDYDQLNPAAGSAQAETGNIRLVKRGEETHGPDGTLNVVRAQVVSMEPMKEDSKVLRAILEYEK